MQIHETYSLHQSNIACRNSSCTIIALQYNYARAHNGLWLHTEVCSHEISYDPFEPGWRTEEKSQRYPGISQMDKHWILQVPQPNHPDVY